MLVDHICAHAFTSFLKCCLLPTIAGTMYVHTGGSWAWTLSREGMLLVVTIIKYPVTDFFFADLEEKQQPCFPYVHCSSVIVQKKSASFFLWCPSPLAIPFAMHQHDLVEMKRSSQGNNVSNRAGFTYHCTLIKLHPMQTAVDSMNPSTPSQNLMPLIWR